MKIPQPDSLDDRLKELPQDVPPPADLWPDIQMHIGRASPGRASPRRASPGRASPGRASPRRARPVLMAACIAAAAACIASIFTWAVLRRVQTPEGLPAVAGGGLAAPGVVTLSIATPAAFQEPGDPRYIKARESLQQTFRERLTLLEPSTRAKIEASLAVIQQAHENIRQALLADPSSAVLEELWQSTWHDEIDLYDRVVEATQPSVRT